MRNSLRTIMATLLAIGAAHTAPAATTYTSTPLTPSPERTYLTVNNGTRVLTMRQDSPAAADLHIVIENWSNGGRDYSEFRPGTLPGSTRSIAAALNDAQQLTGHAETLAASDTVVASRAFLYANGAFADLSALAPLAGATTSAGTGINERGDVVGSWTDASGQHAFVYRDGAITDLGALSSATTPADTRAIAINERGQIAGTSRLPPGAGPGSNAWPHAFLYDGGTMSDLGVLPGYEWSEATAINDAGIVVGTSHLGNHNVNCFIHANGVMRDMGTLGGVSTPFCRVRAINAAGVAVGVSSSTPRPPDFQTESAFVYADGRMTALKSLLAPNDPIVTNNVRLVDAIAINDKGEIIAATGRGEPGTRYYLLTPVTGPLYSFENGTQGWSSTGEPIVTVGTSNAQPFEGTEALAAKFAREGFASVAVMQPLVPAGRTVTFHVYVPTDAGLDWIQPFVLEGEASGWRWSGNWQPRAALDLGAWNTLTVHVPDDATALWSLGVEFYASAPYTATVYVDSVSF